MEVIRAFASNLPGYFYALNQSIMFIGVFLVGLGVWGLWSKRDEPQANYPRSQLGTMFVGGIALSFTFYLETFSMTAFNDSSEIGQMLSYSASTSNDSTKVMVDTLLAFTRAVGWWAFAKGIFQMLSRMKGDAQTSYGKAFVLLVFGTVCANILLFTDSLAASVNLPNFIRDLM